MSLTTSDATAEELLTQFRSWPIETQQIAAEALRAALNVEWQPFYCGNWACDGLPHDAWTHRHGRGDQHPPRTLWDVWIELSGRGAGKTRSGAEWTHRVTKVAPRIALVAPTAADARDTMVEGESGLLATMSPRNPCVYEPSKRRVTWANGARATLFSAEQPNRLRGPQHYAAWVDEACFMANIQTVWDNLLFGMRLGEHPRIHVTTTPKPRPWLRTLLEQPGTHVTRASTYANLSNLAPQFARAVLDKYEGTRLGRQEINAEILDDVEGALWSYVLIDEARVAAVDLNRLERIVVSVDPPGSSHGQGAEAGIVVVGRLGRDAYVIADLSGRMTPDEWGRVAVEAYRRFNADAIVAERNYGGDMVTHTLRTVDGADAIPIRPVTARRGKALRAEPVVALYEQHRVHHVGVLPALEAQQTEWVPGETDESPDRLDALVHGVTDLLVVGGTAVTSSPAQMQRRAAGSYRG